MINLLMITAVCSVLLVLGYLCYRTQRQQLQQRNRQGLQLACNLLELMRAIQQHRGISSAILAGSSDQSTKLRLLAAQVEERFEDLGKQPRLADKAE